MPTTAAMILFSWRITRWTTLIIYECHIALHNIYGSEYERLNKEEQLVLATAFTERSTSNYRMQQLLGKNSLEVEKTLYALVGKGMLVPVNKGRRRYGLRGNKKQGLLHG